MMLRKVLFLSCLLTLPALPTAADVRVDSDRHKDFTRYRTFDVEIHSLVRSDGVVDERNTLAESRLRQAVTRELQARGLEPAGVGADLVVRVSARDTERTDIVSSGWGGYPWYGGLGYFGYRGYFGYGGYGGYFGPYGYGGGGDVWTRRYLAGSLTVDVVERDSGELVYRAQVTDEVGKNLEKHMARAMERAFKKFPVRELAG